MNKLIIYAALAIAFSSAIVEAKPSKQEVLRKFIDYIDGNLVWPAEIGRYVNTLRGMAPGKRSLDSIIDRIPYVQGFSFEELRDPAYTFLDTLNAVRLPDYKLVRKYYPLDIDPDTTDPDLKKLSKMYDYMSACNYIESRTGAMKFGYYAD